MYLITYENEKYKKFHDDYVFDSYDSAKNYLKQKGFVEDNRTFKRINYNWVAYQKAYIEPLKLYKGD